MDVRPQGVEEGQGKLLLDIVKLLQTHNFNFVANINFRGGADSLFFESSLSTFSLATPEEMFAISLNRLDRLRLISASSEVLHCVGSVIQQSWARGIQQVRSYHARYYMYAVRRSDLN